MALFGSAKKTQIARKVRPTVVRTQNVAKEIFTLAKSYDLKPESLDFNILEIQTYTRTKTEKDEGEWKEVSGYNLRELDDESTYLNPNFQIRQTYEIEVFSKRVSDEDLYKDFKTAVGANATKCKVYLSIAGGSKIEYTPRFEQDFLDLINKKKIRAGILVYVFDEMLPDMTSKLTARIRVAQLLEFQKSETQLIAEGFEPTLTTNDNLILHFDKKEELDDNEKIDYAARGFIKSVKKDELLIEYIKAKAGKAGRNCRGEYMKPAEPVVKHEPTFKVDETIKITEDENSIKYYANENGYISFENDTYVVKNEVDVGEISFKTTGSIESGVNSDVDISVKETDAVKDAVGTGMLVEVTKINIEGNVGSNAKVIAKEAVINGQTHKTAIIKADDLEINVHKGKAYGENIRVTRLEHGEIEGKQIKVAQALGGIILGKEIDIDICASHVKATASKRIEIQKMQGSENIFTIDPLLKKDLKEDLNKNKEKIKLLKIKVKELDKEIKKQTQLIKNATPAFLEIKKRLLHYKKNNVKLPDSFVKKYKQFQNINAHFKELKTDYTVAEDQLNLLLGGTSTFGENILDARIINHDRWMGYNEIRFKIVEPPVELVYKPADGSREQVFGVVELEDGEFAIRPMSEEGNENI